METHRTWFNLTEDVIKQWESVCNETAWLGSLNLSLQFSNSLGIETRIIKLPDKKTEDIVHPKFDDDPTNLDFQKWPLFGFLIGFIPSVLMMFFFKK